MDENLLKDKTKEFDTTVSPSFSPPSQNVASPFFPPLPKKEFFSNTWRNIIALLLLIMSAAGTFFFLHTQNKPWQVFASWANFDLFGLIQTKNFSFNEEKPVVVIQEPVPLPIPKLVGTLPLPEKFTADSIVVRDYVTQEILYAKNEVEKRPIASISKLLSALVILEKNPNWNTTTTITFEPNINDSHFLNGEVYSMEDIWEAFLVGSSNQAIFSLIDALSLDRDTFVHRMNEKALELGMKDSQFVEPTGLSEQNISTASDVVLLLDAALKEEKIQDILLLKQVTISPVNKKKPHQIWNTNWLLIGWIPNSIQDFRGGKTGYITASGYNFTMQIAENDQKIIDVVILGADKHEFRFSEARDIGAAVFNAFVWPSDKNF